LPDPKTTEPAWVVVRLTDGATLAAPPVTEMARSGALFILAADSRSARAARVCRRHDPVTYRVSQRQNANVSSESTVALGMIRMIIGVARTFRRLIVLVGEIGPATKYSPRNNQSKDN
jgi:hypothetical protein